MIKFFCHIRQTLIMENKTSKYLKYAIGEIVLVMIGILLALQINNWNENRKIRAFEVKMLSEIRLELIRDTIYFNAIKERPTSANESIDKIIKFMDNGESENDSILKYINNSINLSFQFIYHKGAYESLKSVGFDKISNDTIRIMMTGIYDFDLPRAGNLIVSGEARSKLAMENNFPKLFKYEMEKTPRGNRPALRSRVDNLVENSDFIELIMYRKGYAMNSISRLNSIIRDCTELLLLLDKELEIKDPLSKLPNDKWN